jgi:hypothetical protein
MGFTVINGPTQFNSSSLRESQDDGRELALGRKPGAGAKSGPDAGMSEPLLAASPIEQAPAKDKTASKPNGGGVSPAGQNAKHATSDIAEVAKEAIQSTVKALAAQASELTANVADELSTTAGAQKDRGADVMRGFAKAMDTAAEELRTQSPQVARGVRGVARNVESLADNLRTQSIPDLFRGASEFARKQPASFFAGAVVAGFALSRFLKSHKPSAVPISSVGSEAGAGSATSSMGE